MGWTMSAGAERHEFVVADDVFGLEVGRGMLRSNVYFVRSGSKWVLMDTGFAGCAGAIRRSAATLFGERDGPVAILLTHIHPDHSGAAPKLSRDWDCPVYVHPDELRFATAGASTYFATYEQYWDGHRRWRPPPLDRWILLPLMHVLPQQRRNRMLDEQSLEARARSLETHGTVPHLVGWEAIPTPGHTPGHVVFFRRLDRLLIAGDAVTTVELNTVRGLSLWTAGGGQEKLAGPPRYFTWNWRVATDSIATIARLEPAIVAPGHGPARQGADVAAAMKSAGYG